MSQIEHGNVSASPDVLLRLATALGCRIVDLMPPESSAGNAA